MASVHQRAAARRDLIAHAAHLVENAGEGTAERFLDKAEATFETLAGQPTMGAPLTLRRPELAGLRKWCIDGFDNHLIFYLCQALHEPSTADPHGEWCGGSG